MARPPKEGMDYFPHDVDAANDEKIEALRSLYGNDGYAFYFILLERIYRTSDFELDVSDAETIQILSRKIGIQPELFNRMICTSIKHGAFDRQEFDKRGVLTSQGIKKRSSVVISKRDSMKLRYDKKVSVIISDAETHEETMEETPQSKVKIKERESKDKEKDLKDFLPGAEPPDKPKYNADADPSNEYHQAAVHFAKMVLNANPTCKVPKEGTEAMGKWAKEIRLMFESDKRDRDHVKDTLTFCFEKDSFWSHTCQSPANFRKNYDKISGKMIATSKQETRKPINSYERSVLALHNWAQNGGTDE